MLRSFVPGRATTHPTCPARGRWRALGTALVLAWSACAGGESGGRARTGAPSSASAARLETVELVSAVFGNKRLLRVLLPPGYDEGVPRRYPVLYLLDGQTLFHASDSYTTHVWHVDQMVARLLEEEAIEPLIVVGIDNPGLGERPNELLPWFDAYLSPPLPDPQGKRFPELLVTEVMPLIESRYRVLEGEQHTGLGGVSYGGLASLYAVIHRPGIFGRLLIESPGFYVNDTAVLREAEAFDGWPEKVSLGVGTNEEGRDDCDEDDMSSEAVRDVLRLEGVLKRKGLSDERLLLQIALCGEHGEQHYRRRFPRAMRFLYGSAPGGRVTVPTAATSPRPSS